MHVSLALKNLITHSLPSWVTYSVAQMPGLQIALTVTIHIWHLVFVPCDSASHNKGLLGVMKCSIEVVYTVDCFNGYSTYKGVTMRGKE